MITNGIKNITTADLWNPGAYRLEEVLVKNSYGREFDLKNLVTKIVITESLYMISLMAEIEFRDTVNIFEELRISGHEDITIKIIKVNVLLPKGEEKEVLNLKLKVSEIPTYGKANNATQAFVLRCVSPHAFVNNVVTISRTVTGSILKAIQSIIKNDLVYDGVIESEASAKGNVKVIIPNMKPFKAIAWLLKNAFGSNSSPIFVYDTLHGIRIHSYDFITRAESVGEYNLYFLEQAAEHTIEGYVKRKYKILSIASDMNSSRFIHSDRGAFASTTKILDYAKKKYYDVKYDYSAKFHELPRVDHAGKSLIPSNMKIKDESLNHHHDSFTMYMSENSMSYGSYENYHYPALQSMGMKRSILEGLELYKHTLKVHGDISKLNPGNKITILAPKSVDPKAYKASKNDSHALDDYGKDDMVSGDYIIVSSRHTFEEQYTCELLIQRDFSNYSFDSK